MLTLKHTLADTVPFLSVPTLRALLACISGIREVNKTTSRGCLVSKECLKLEETPAVYPESLFLSEFLAVVSDIGQVLKYNRGAWRDRFNNPFRNNMVHILPETVLLHSQFLKVPLGGTSSFGLEILSQFVVSAYRFLNMAASKEFICGSNCDLIYSPVNADNFTIRFNISGIFFKDNTKKNLVTTDKEFSGFSSPVNILVKIWWCLKVKFLSSRNSGDGQLPSVKPQRERVLVIPNTGLLRDWTRSLLSFLDSGLNAFQGFSSFVYGGTGKLRRQECSAMLIDFMLERYRIAVPIIPPHLADRIKRLGVRLDGRHYR